MAEHIDPRAKPVPLSWQAPIRDWTLALRAAGQSEETIRSRTDHLRRASRALLVAPWDVTPEALASWVGSRTWARETRRIVYASLRSFWRWAHSSGLTVEDPTIHLPRVRAIEPQPRPAPAIVVQEGRHRANDRVRLILRLAAEAGLRRTEIALVHVDDLLEDLEGWSLLVHGKGGRTRIVPLTRDLARVVIEACRAGGGYALPGEDDGHLSPQWVGKLASRVLPGSWTLHTLRHAFATDVHDATGDLIIVQQLLGHASVATTQRYVLPKRERLREAVQRIAA